MMALTNASMPGVCTAAAVVVPVGVAAAAVAAAAAAGAVVAGGGVAAGVDAVVVVAVLVVEAAAFPLRLWKTLPNGSVDVGSGFRNVGLVAIPADEEEAVCRLVTRAGLVLVGSKVTTECAVILIRQTRWHFGRR